MADITETENKFLNSLVQDCIIYRLTTKEGREYIKERFKEISEPSYKKRKARVLSDDSTHIWLNYITRIGFVKHHKEQIEYIQKIQDDSLRQLFAEIHNMKGRNEDLILKLKRDIRNNALLLSELGAGTPILSSIEAGMAHQRERIERLISENGLLKAQNSTPIDSKNTLGSFDPKVEEEREEGQELVCYCDGSIMNHYECSKCRHVWCPEDKTLPFAEQKCPNCSSL